LTLKCDGLVSSFAFKCSVRRYNKDFKTMQAGTLPLPVFEAMLDLYSRLRMPSSAEGVFIDMLVAGRAVESFPFQLL
jgi:hypothetical protein